jgi:hypothetical protein
MPSRRVPSRSAPPAPPGEARRITVYAAHTVLRRPFRDTHLFFVRQGRLTLGTLSAARGQVLLVAAGTEGDLRHDPAGDARHETAVLCFDATLTGTLPTALDAPAAQVRPAEALLSAAVQEATAFLQARSVSAAQQRQRLMAVLQHLAAADVRLPVALPGVMARGGASDEEARLEAALNLLQGTRLPLATVVQQCGGEHPSRFSAAFTARFGFAPSLLRAGPAAPR